MKFKRVFATGFMAFLAVAVGPLAVSEEPRVTIFPDAPEAEALGTPEGWARELSAGSEIPSLFFRNLLNTGQQRELLTALVRHLPKFDGKFELNGSKRYVLVFAPPGSGWGPLTVVLTDEGLNVLSWRKVGLGESIELVTEEKQPILALRFTPSSLGFSIVDRYRLSDDSIDRYGPPFYEPVNPPPETQEERDFFAEVKRSAPEELKENLGVIPPAPKDWPGEPGSVADFDRQFLGRKRLKWIGTSGKGMDLRRILILDAGFEEWPSFQYVTMVVTDRDYRVRSWRTAGGKEKFCKAELRSEHGKERLHVTFQDAPFQNGNFRAQTDRKLLEERYLIEDDGILHLDRPDFDPPHYVTDHVSGGNRPR